MSQGSLPTIYGYNYASANPGSNGFVVDASQFNSGQDWYILVNASTNAQWSLVSGDVFVYNLGSLAADASSSTNAAIGAEGMAFFRTTIPSTTLAWQLWLNGSPNALYVKKSAAPDPASYDLTQAGQMLVVPPYLAGGTFNGSYFVGVSGVPGTPVNLDSRQQPIIPLAFSSLTNLSVGSGSFPYVTYQVQVPVQQIAWQLNLAPTSGNPSIAVRGDVVPNEFRNDAFSEVPQGVGASVSLVPPPPNSGTGTPGLSDGTFFVTVYSTTPYSCAFSNANPVITDVHYLFSITNDAPNRAGWRYYRITTINEQLGTLGWALSLANQVSGTEIAIRRNAVPGQWNYRDNDNYSYANSLGYVDLASTYGLLQQPGHQADVWYIGVYTPAQALGSFVLSGSQLTGQPLPFDGAGSSVSVANQPPGQWGFFRVTVPPDANLLGWDLRLVGVTNGNPHLVVSRDTLPTGLNSSPWPWWQPALSTQWPSGSQWGDYLMDWTGCGVIPMLVTGLGNPLEPGTYYVGVQDPNGSSSYTLQSRGIGLSSYSIAVRDLPVSGSVSNLALTAGEADYYRVAVPSNAPDWQLQLKSLNGDALLKVQKDYLPNSGSQRFWIGTEYGAVVSGQSGQKMMKPGDEQWALLPYYDSTGRTNLLPGTYYAVVVSQGQNQTNANCNGPGSGWGVGSSSYTLSSWMESATSLPNTLSYGTDLLFTNTQAGGQLKSYQFNVPPGIASIEVRLENRVGNPTMYLASGSAVSGTAQWWGSSDPYGNYGGTYYVWRDGNLLTVPNPAGAYSLSVYASPDGSGNFPDASYILRVRAVPPPLVAFDGGTYTITNQAAITWQFFQVNVPSDPNLLGWDLRLVGVTNGNPHLVVSRDTLPTGLNSSPWPWWQPALSTQWPSGSQWGDYLMDWTGCGVIPMLVTGLGNPLEPGTYYVGVQDPNGSSSYTLQSRGIGLSSYSIAVRDLPVSGSVSNLALTAGEADYYRVAVPSNAPDWQLQLKSLNGDALLKVQKDYLPNSGSQRFWIGTEYGAVVSGQSGQKMMKPGDEQWALLPYYDSTGRTNLLPGTYYAVVVSQGQNQTNANCNGPGSGWGVGSSSYTLSSWMESATSLPNTLSYGTDLLFTNTQAGGQLKSYQFNVPPGIASIEVRLENRVGNPTMYLASGSAVSGTAQWWGSSDPYGNYGGTYYVWRDGNLLTVPNPAGAYSLSVYASPDGSGNFPDASYTLRVRAPALPQLSFSPGLNTGGTTNFASGLLADTQHAYYQVAVPALVNGAPVLGWKLDLTALTGSPSLRVRRDLLPDNNTCDSTGYGTGTVIIAPPYMTPGVWYVDVVGSGSTSFSLTSSAITTNTLAHPLWTMPQPGQTGTAPGLVFPAIGDSGIDTNGNPILDSQAGTVTDQGIDLKQGHFDLYAVVVPTNNAGLLRTELQAISGNPNLYLRVGAAPTLNHYAQGSCDFWDGQLVDRQLTGGTTEYGNWVPLNGRYQSALTPGIWVLGVQAGGNANARYRLQLSCGNAVTNGVVQDLALNGGSYTYQNLSGGDWRYYRVQVPDPAPANWTVSWSRSLGSARMFIRDTAPPGDGHNPADFSNASYNPGPGSSDLETWNTDTKNQGPYPRFDAPGTVTLSTPPLRPGGTYYLGFWSPVDTTFSVSSATSGGPVTVTNSIAFYGGSVNKVVPAYACLFFRMDVPPEATRILFNASNSTNLVLALEQGTMPQPGGPAHWTSYQYNNSQYPNEANATLNQFLATPNNWPWLPGFSYYLAVTNASPTPENFSLNLSLPTDLAPLAASATPSVISTRPYPSVQVVWGVTNRGALPASGSWYDAVWCSTSGVLDANSVIVGNFWVNSQPLAPGGTYWQTNTVALPLTASGPYTLFVQVDAGNSIYESSVSDKVSAPLAGTFTLTPPDLAPVQLLAPATFILTNPNPSIQLAWCVTNRGPGAASGGWLDRVWFSTDGAVDAQSVSLGDFYFSQTLAPGGSYWQTNTVTLPLTNPASYTLFVQVDPYNWLYESTKTNNLSAPVPGAAVLPSQNPRLAGSGFTTNGGFRLAVYGQQGQAYTLQASTNLVNWVSLATFTCTNAPTYVVDSAAKNYSRRFYRIVQGGLPIPITLGLGSPAPLSARGLYLMVEGASGSSVTIQASTNLVNWQAITNFVSSASPAYFYDPGATNYSRRFYRAKLGQ
jgi:hypothetical protein